MPKKDENRPAYADFPTIEKFMAIESIIAKRLKEHPKAICSYSGGSDSDILIDLVERVRKMFGLAPVAYEFFNTGLEMKATKNHVKEMAEKYGVEITEYRPKINIVKATREYGIPFISKIVSQGIYECKKHNIPLSIKTEYEGAEDKPAKYRELKALYPGGGALGVGFLCSCDSVGRPCHSQISIDSAAYLWDFLDEYPPDFQISAMCCNYCKKQVAHKAQKGFDLIITGERQAEGGVRAISYTTAATTPCFKEYGKTQWRLRPLYYVSDKDKAWYKEYYGIRYSDAYEVYGLRRTGCCGCSINSKAAYELELIRPYEPSLVKAAWNVFGDSYRYRQQYNEYRKRRIAEEKSRAEQIDGQMNLADYEGIVP